MNSSYNHLPPHFFTHIKSFIGDRMESCRNMKNDVLNYVQPTVEVLEVNIEKGFATSPPQLEDPGNGGDI